MTPAPPKPSSLINPAQTNRNEKLNTLQDGYTPAKRRVEILVLIVFATCWLSAIKNVFEIIDTQTFILSFVGLFIAMFVGDFLGGVVHWACDTWGAPTTPVTGVFIRSFREHHIDPRAMTHHDFVEVSADSCIIPIPFLIAVTFWRIETAYTIELLILHITIWTTLFVMMTNQIHKWAHTSSYNRPYIVRMLQSMRLVLNPTVHNVHHRPPFDQNYCILNGWMNPILASVDFWRHTENLITKYTGYIPRADDADWTGRFEIDNEGKSIRKDLKASSE